MKKAFITLIMLIVVNTISAQHEERFAFGFYTEAADKNTHTDKFDYGFNLGAYIELQGNLMYLRARTFWFPDLNNIPYFDFDGGGGFNWRSKFDQSRIYVGGFIGAINREGWGHAKIGLELGYDFYFDNGFFIGIKGDISDRHDDKIWRNKESGHTVKSIGLTFGKSL